MIDVAAATAETTVQLPAQATTYTFTPLIPGREYQYRIQATNLIGSSPWSDRTVGLYPGVEPTRPGVITFTATTRTTITFTFAGLSGAEDTGGTTANPLTVVYNIYWSLAAGSGW